MEEPPGGANYGRRRAPETGASTPYQPLDTEALQAAEFLRDGGWTVARIKDPSQAGMTGHRGALHPDEYVDKEALQEMIEGELGFTYDEVRSVYRQGPLSEGARDLRSRIDARVLQLAASGANLALLCRCLGFPVKDNGNCRTMENALARARQACH